MKYEIFNKLLGIAIKVEMALWFILSIIGSYVIFAIEGATITDLKILLISFVSIMIPFAMLVTASPEVRGFKKFIFILCYSIYYSVCVLGSALISLYSDLNPIHCLWYWMCVLGGVMIATVFAKLVVELVIEYKKN